VGAPAPQGDDDRRARWGATTRCATAEKHFVLMHVGELFARADAGNRGHWTISAGDSSFELWLSRKPRRTFIECREMAMNGGRAGRNGRYEGGPPGQRGPQREAARNTRVWRCCTKVSRCAMVIIGWSASGVRPQPRLAIWFVGVKPNRQSSSPTARCATGPCREPPRCARRGGLRGT
jgi:hypothetical protein